MAESHKQPFTIPDFEDEVIILEMENDDIVLDDSEQVTAETYQPTEESEHPISTEAVYTPTPGENLIAQNQVAGFSLISVVLFVICGILAGFEVFKIWTHQ